MRNPYLWPVVVLIGVVYFPTAQWLNVVYDPFAPERVPKVAGVKVLLQRPFNDFIGSPFAVNVTDASFARLADHAADIEHSPIVIYEGDTPLGPGHSVHRDIGKIGLGRFSHWRYKYSVFLFSSSDNTDPRTNGRSYWAVIPKGSP